MRRLITLVAPLLAVAIIGLVPIAKAGEQRPVVAVKGERLTVQVQDRPLDWVLEEISRASRVAIVRAAGVGDERVSLQLHDVPLDEALREILTDHDAFFFYGVEREAPASLSVIWVYPKGQGRGFAPVPPEAWASTQEIQEQAKTDPDPAARAKAIEALVERKGGQARDAVLEALRDRDDQVRTQALYAALSAGLGIPAQALTQMALRDPSPNVRFLALQGLASDPNARAAISVETVATQALSDPSPHVQIKAREILDRLDQAARPPRPTAPAQGQLQPQGQ